MSISPDNITLSQQQKELLARLADETGRPWSEVLNESLCAYRGHVEQAPEAEESFYDAATRLGLIGCVDGGPPDLSTNPKYMEGFGKGGS
jgi:hypothetical protein